MLLKQCFRLSEGQFKRGILFFMNNLRLIADMALAEASGSELMLVDATDESLEEHDEKYHDGHYTPDQKCEKREKMEAGDNADASTTGGTDKPDDGGKRSRVKEIFREWRHNYANRSNSWLARNIGITDQSGKSKVNNILGGYLSRKYGKHDTVDKLNAICKSIPKDAWKPTKKEGEPRKSTYVTVKSDDKMDSIRKLIKDKAKDSLVEFGKGLVNFAQMMDQMSLNVGGSDANGTVTDKARDDMVRQACIDWRNGKLGSVNSLVSAVADIGTGKGYDRNGGSGSAKQQTFSFGGGSGSGWMSASSGKYSQHFHSQGTKKYSEKLHPETGLYLTERPGGQALAREEDIPGKSPFNKRRPSFVEHGDVPDAVTEDQLKKFKFTANGSTYPMVGNIDGRNYIVKRGKLPHGIRKNDDLTDHIDKEVAADKFIRNAGLRAPVCKTFDLKGEHMKIAEYVDGGVSLVRSWDMGTKQQREKIRQQVLDSYPVMSFLANIDVFKNDNALVDKDSNVWFIDNGACFDYRAQGGSKGWFYERKDPTDLETGYLGLLYNKDQRLLQEILSTVSDREIVEAAKKYNFTEMVETLPDDIKKPELVEYAKKLDAAVRNPPAGWPPAES